MINKQIDNNRTTQNARLIVTLCLDSRIGEPCITFKYVSWAPNAQVSLDDILHRKNYSIYILHISKFKFS